MMALRERGVNILECRDVSRWPLKLFKLFIQHWKIRKSYDYLWVGYPGHPVVWLSSLISRKPVIFDAVYTMQEGVLTSRKQKGIFSWKSIYVKIIDWLGVKCADLVLVESYAQKEFFKEKFGIDEKCKVLYIGASASFYPDSSVPKYDKFTVLFRGQFLPEAGAKYVVEAAKILEDSNVNFVMVGNGFLLREIEYLVQKIHPKNLRLITRNFTQDELRVLMQPCHVALGQLENHIRLNRTIPHKCYETIAMSIPYMHARFRPVAEILKDGESVLFVNPADPKDLAEKILYLKNNPEIAKKIGDNGYKVYQERFTPRVLASDILKLFSYKH